MESQQSASPLLIGVRFGLLIAVVAVLLDFLLRIVGISILAYSAVTFVVGLLVAIVGVVFAHRAFRNAHQGMMSYGQGVLIAVVAIMIWALVSALFNYLYVNYIDPDFVARMKDEMTALMTRMGLPDEQIAQSVAKFDEMRSPIAKALWKGLASGAVIGAVLGFIISAFTKRKPADFD